MNYNNKDLERIARQISSQIEESLIQAGIFYRIFFRCKADKSLIRKLSNINTEGILKYNTHDKFIRDVIGVRINLYFLDDLDIVTKFIKAKFETCFVEETIDLNNTTEFKPTRINIIYKIPNDFILEFREVVKDKRVDCTYELQLRTIFSEGWHEVEHDLRYKCSEDWDEYPDLSRALNGMLASLETNEWSIIQLFERLSYSHYKKGDLSAMIRTKLRIRFEDLSIGKEVKSLIISNEAFQKDFFKLERVTVIDFLLRNKFYFPMNLENTIYLVNYFFIKNRSLIEITPDLLIRDFKAFD